METTVEVYNTGLNFDSKRPIQMVPCVHKGWMKSAEGLLIIVICIALNTAHAYDGLVMGNEPVVTRIIVDVRGVKGDAAPWVDLVKHLIFVQEKEPFSVKRFQDSIRALKSSRLFKAVETSQEKQEGKKITLRFEVTPYPLIEDIKISGAFPLLEREVLNTLQLYTGNGYHPETFPDKKAALVSLFKREGYIAPKVSLTAAENPRDGNVVVFVSIDKGSFFHIRRFEIKGNRAFSGARLKLRLSTWKSSLLPYGLRRFREKKFNKDIQNLIRFYRQKGYPDVVVNPTVDKKNSTQSVFLTLAIDEGPRYRVEFIGNTEFSNYTLRKDLVIFKEGNKNGFGLRKSIRKIKDRYLKAGYMDCRIEMESEDIQQKGEAIRQIRLVIKEGPQYIVNTVNIMGNHALDSKKIHRQILTQSPGIFTKGGFSRETLEADKRAITLLYQTHGYMDVEVKDQVKWRESDKKNRKKVDVTFDIQENRQTRVTSVAIRGLNVLPESEALAAIDLKKGAVYRSYMMQSDENKLTSLISEKGYPHVQVKGTADINENYTQAVLTYNLIEGPFVEMGHVAFSGNFITKARVMENEIKLDPGDPFSLKKFLASERNIRDIDVFESVHFKTFGLKEKEKQVNLLMEIEEKKPYYMQFGAGYGTDTGLYGNALAGDRNVFGLNKNIWGKAGASETGYRGDIGITEPRFFKTRIRSVVNVFAEKSEPFNTNFGTNSIGGSISFYRKFHEHLTATLSFVYENRDQYPRDSEPIPSEEESEYGAQSVFVARPSLIYSSLDSYILPKKGLFSSLSMDISKGFDNSLDTFLKYRFEFRKYYTPLEWLTIALRGRVGYIDSLDSSGGISEDQLFFLGGASTVRGYAENLLRFDLQGKAVGGLGEILANIEARIYLGFNLQFSMFYDTGSVRDAVDNPGSKGFFSGSNEFRSGVGAGLHYLTPVGPIGVYYGHKLDRLPDESPGEFYFTIGFRF